MNPEVLNGFFLFQEQVEWAVEYKADFIIGETFNDLGEAMLALESIKKYGKGYFEAVGLATEVSETRYTHKSFISLGKPCKKYFYPISCSFEKK